jgi:hypothetical protein
VANGTRHEASEDNGVAHFIEHMLFKCAAAHIRSPVRSTRWGILNAFTDMSMSAITPLLANFPRAADLLADIFRTPPFRLMKSSENESRPSEPRCVMMRPKSSSMTAFIKTSGGAVARHAGFGK